ncbi:Flagellin [Maioricimonas rarisocia]|uniref:Flagellin n=1 Tax=Maioricimonas rarisocia TaxID=2528026 RepID=A0A517ZCN2_9PLAN|nr:flagellin [Maioricimonas rarisocia]QDU40212.1 Flagellin [Maioricimonas rarisocia]
MALVLANNVSSLNAQHNLTRSSNNLAKSVERLSSGLKINRGADGPAALVISEKQRAQIAGLEQAIENSEKAVSLVQTAEGALNEINSLLVKVRSLALDSANAGVNDTDALAANQAEISNALDTINRIANNTQFGTKKLLDGSAGVTGTATDTDISVLKATADTAAGTYAVSVGTRAERAYVDTTTALAAGTLAQDETLTINDVSITLNSGLTRVEVQNRINEFTAQTGVVAEDDGAGTGIRLRTEAFGTAASISVVSNQSGANSAGFTTSEQTDTGVNAIATIGANTFTGVGNVVTATSGVTEGLVITIGADPADSTQTVNGANGNVSISDNALQFQVGPNANQTAEIAIDKVNPTSLGVGVAGNQFASLNDVDVTSATKAQDAIAVIDAAIDDITNARGTLGAFQQNTLESTANNLRTTLENTVNAESVIRDTDFASEIANFTRQQVLVQAGTSVLGNANQQSQLVLSLLQ